MFPVWDGYYAVVALGVIGAVLMAGDAGWPRKIGAITAIAGIALLYALAGRRLAQAHIEDRRSLTVVLMQTMLFTIAVLCVSFTAYLLFAVIPMIFLAVPLRTAIPIVVLANLVPVLAGLLSEGFTAHVLGDLGPIALISIAFAVWLGYWVDRVIEQSVERAALITQLGESRAEVARLSHEAGAEAERARLAGEIHDTLAQGFTSIITLLQAADPALRDERIALAVRTARENLAESRSLIGALAPSALTSGSLPDAVRRQTSRLVEEAGVTAGCRVTGSPRALPTAVEVVLLRAAQEALTNVRRHAGAREVSVLLAYARSSVRLVVRDDGCGFDVPAAGGFGLNGMRARVAEVNGTLTVRSNPSTGTTIELEVPA
jgi:signal transduction histidine kinase